jgi:hypothetical protein
MATIMHYPAYGEFVFYDHNKQYYSLWTIPGPLSRDLVAGLVAGLRLMLDDIQRKIDRKGNYIVSLTIMGRTGREHWTFNVMNGYESVMELYFPHAKGYHSKEMITLVQNHRFGPNPHNEWFGWWIRAPNDLRYALYSFPTPDFIQGFISMCNAFGVDFRDYVYGLPFKYNHETREVTYYQIEGYDIPQI